MARIVNSGTKDAIFKATNDNEIIKTGESFFGIRTIYKDSNERTHSITVKYKDHKKKNRKKY